MDYQPWSADAERELARDQQAGLKESIRRKDIEIERLRTQVNSLIAENAKAELIIKDLRNSIYETACYHMSRREPL